MVLETMGRDSGFIALYGGVAGGADAVLIPELVYDLEALADHVTRIRAEEKGYVLVTVAEGVPGPGGETVTLPYYGSGSAAGGVGTVHSAGTSATRWNTSDVRPSFGVRPQCPSSRRSHAWRLRTHGGLA